MFFSLQLDVVDKEISLGQQFERLTVLPRNDKEKKSKFSFTLRILKTSEHGLAHLVHRLLYKGRVHLIAALREHLEIQGIAFGAEIFIDFE